MEAIIFGIGVFFGVIWNDYVEQTSSPDYRAERAAVLTLDAGCNSASGCTTPESERERLCAKSLVRAPFCDNTESPDD